MHFRYVPPKQVRLFLSPRLKNMHMPHIALLQLCRLGLLFWYLSLLNTSSSHRGGPTSILSRFVCYKLEGNQIISIFHFLDNLAFRSWKVSVPFLTHGIISMYLFCVFLKSGISSTFHLTVKILIVVNHYSSRDFWLVCIVINLQKHENIQFYYDIVILG